MGKKRYLGMAGLLAVSFLLVTACGSSGSASKSPPTGASGSTVAGPAGQPIRLGTIGSYSGANASSFGKVPEVIDAWVDSVNAAGGINGHPVKMFIKDDAGSPTTSLQDAKELVQTDHVVAIVGEYSTVDDSFATYAAAQGVPVIGGNPNDTVSFTNADYFPSGSNVVTGIAGEFAVMKQNGLSKLGLMYCAEAPVCAQLGGLAKGLATLFPGESVAYTGQVAATSPNYNSQCLAAERDHVDALFAAGNSSIDQRVYENCKQLGLSAKPLNTAASATADWLKSSALQGMYLVGPDANYVDTSSPGVAAFNTAIKKYASDLPGTPNFVQADLYTWAGGELFEAAAKAANIGPNSTPAEVKNGLYSLKGETLGGITPPLTYARNEPTFLSCYFPQQISNGTFKTVGSSSPTCLSPAQVTGIEKILSAT